jgi:[ribosomal protein S18]-alanine N-acetyltransferase
MDLCLMSPSDMPSILAIEMQSYSHPWSERNFSDSIQSGYWCPVLKLQEQFLAYMVVMQGVDEAHLLNITTHPARRGLGIGRWMLSRLCEWSRLKDLAWVWLEVRASNLSAQALYREFGFVQVGRRANYYPATPSTGSPGSREDALVMSYRLN